VGNVGRRILILAVADTETGELHVQVRDTEGNVLPYTALRIWHAVKDALELW